MAKGLKTAPGVVWQEVRGETVIVNPGRQQAWVLDRTATRLWKLLTGQVRMDAVLRVLSKEFGLPIPELRLEVERFQSQMAGVGLIEAAPAGGPVLKQSLLSPPPGVNLFSAKKPDRPITQNGGSFP